MEPRPVTELTDQELEEQLRDGQERLDELELHVKNLPGVLGGSAEDFSSTAYLAKKDTADPESGSVKETSSSPSDGKEAGAERGGWNNKLDFLFSCISVSVGLGNIWRFPYLCFKNGGGAFLITYFIAMVCCGIPIFFQEVAIGQYLGMGGMTMIGKLAPIMKGVGYATMTVVFYVDIYYSVIIAWTLFYFIASFVDIPGLPWADCGNRWNTDACYVPGVDNITNAGGNNVSAVEEYWENRVLGISDGITDLGGIRWELFGCLLLGWTLVYFIVWKGINESGKVVWFTALFPYVIMLILLVRSVTLDGAADGLLYFVKPDWSLLLTPQPWIDGSTQIFFAYSIGLGALPSLGSYNQFKYNSFRDSIITCVVNTATCLLAGIITFSILGNIAKLSGQDISEVVTSGPGLVFITYPEVVQQLAGAPAWAILFFFMLMILGVDSLFCVVEAIVTGLSDNWPGKLRKHRKMFTFVISLIMFLLALPMITNGGVYIFQLMDAYAASGLSMLWLVFFQTITISWIFGTSKFSDCIEEMMGRRPSKFFEICWAVLGPAVMFVIFVFYLVQYQPVTYGSGENIYEYPNWAEAIGLCISISSMIWIPGYFVYYIIVTPGTIKEVIRKGLKPEGKLGRGH